MGDIEVKLHKKLRKLIPNTIKRIKNRTFPSCIKIKSIKIPESVAFIGERAFAGCNELSNISYSKKVKDIGKNAFIGTLFQKKVILSKRRLQTYGQPSCRLYFQLERSVFIILT